MKSTVIGCLVLLALLTTASALGAEGYPKGHGALEIFDNEGFANTPMWVRVWVGFLVSTFALGLIFFVWKHPLARWAVGGFLISSSTGEMVFAGLGLPFLSGSIAIMHIVCWTPVLILLLLKRPFLNPSEGRWFRLWSAVLTGAILFSFIFDIRDAVIYLNHVAGLA